LTPIEGVTANKSGMVVATTTTTTTTTRMAGHPRRDRDWDVLL
jgi:hypothetical protein